MVATFSAVINMLSFYILMSKWEISLQWENMPEGFCLRPEIREAAEAEKNLHLHQNT